MDVHETTHLMLWGRRDGKQVCFIDTFIDFENAW